MNCLENNLSKSKDFSKFIKAKHKNESNNSSNLINNSFNHNKIKVNKLNSLNIKKDGDIIEEENLNAVNSNLKYYNTSEAAKDFFLHLFAILYCRCKYNKQIVQEKNIFSNKINKLLSINYLFKKLHLLELLVSKNFSASELNVFHKKYLLNMVNNTSSNLKENCDDSKAFNYDY